MNPIDLRVTFLDKTEEVVTALAADLIAFEGKFDMSVSRLGNDVRLTHLFFLAWHALKRAGKTSEDFEKWTESVSMVTGEDPKK
jgi:hypothetical protein